ncbi:MAG: MBL fold metallo-hydrolase, partial [Thaumarchaeota archaeon]|nr:MBL fold metallo-hydrolase [Nitrososphaerota archaeon]
MTSITFYGGINEIGGNKFLVEDKGTRIFLDFGMQMGKVNEYYGDFLQPRTLNGMGDLFEFGLLPKLEGIYRRDFSKHMGFGDHNKETKCDGILLTHAHVDHAAYIHYLRPEIPIYCTEATKLIMQT